MRNGTRRVKKTPLKTEISAYSFPINFVIMGSVVSIDVTPPEAIGESLPKYFANNGVKSSVKLSLKIFARSARTPRVSPYN